MARKLRNLAISGVDTEEQMIKVYSLIGGDDPFDKGNEPSVDALGDESRPWFFDNGEEQDWMYWWDLDDKDEEGAENLNKCRQMTYTEFLRQYDKPLIVFEL